MLDEAGLAVHEHVVGVARDHAHFHSAGSEKVMQAAIAFARQQQVESTLCRLPRGDESAGQRVLAVARRLGDLHVARNDARPRAQSTSTCVPMSRFTPTLRISALPSLTTATCIPSRLKMMASVGINRLDPGRRSRGYA